MNKEYKYIDSDKDFERFYETLQCEKIIAVDLEADSMHHFKEKVCLIQIAGRKTACVLDPLKIDDFSKFKILMEDEKIEKVFHGSDFDIRSLDREYKIQINNLFDTEIACRFLGIKERGLAALLKKYFNVFQDKKFQKKDWSVRPLPDEMISYSIVDVLYLIELKGILEEKLKEMQRLEWAKEEFLKQTEVKYTDNTDNYKFLKFKGAGRMDRKTLAVLESLLLMRMENAERKDLPLFKVLGAGEISQIALNKPANLIKLQKTGILTSRQLNLYGKECINAVNKALKIKEGDLPVYPKTRSLRLNKIEQKRVKLLKQMREKKSEGMMLEQGFLINNALITKLAVENPLDKYELEKIEPIRKWQVKVLADDIFKALSQGA